MLNPRLWAIQEYLKQVAGGLVREYVAARNLFDSDEPDAKED